MSESTDPAALGGEDLETWASLATVLEWLPAALDAQLNAEAGITHFEYGVLYALSRADDHRLRLNVLAGYANSTMSRLSRAVSRLEKRGWIERNPDPADGRSTFAVLTAAGLEQCRAATPAHVDTVRRLVLDPLTRNQRRQLTEISRRIQRSIRAEAGWQAPTSAAPRD